MKWQIWNFPTGELVPVLFDSYREARERCDVDKQTVVSICTTDEDAMYMGSMGDISCEHALDPTDCIHCNPEFRDAYYTTCPWCNEHNIDGNWTATWSVPWTRARAVQYVIDLRAEYGNDADAARKFRLAQYLLSMVDETNPIGDPTMVKCLCCGEPHEWTKEWKP